MSIFDKNFRYLSKKEAEEKIKSWEQLNRKAFSAILNPSFKSVIESVFYDQVKSLRSILLGNK